MTSGEKALGFGWRVYGLGVTALGVVCLTWGDFVLGQPVPKGFPARTALAHAAGAFMLIASAAVQWRRTTAQGAAALTAYYAIIVVLLMNGRVLLTHYSEYVTYEGIAEQLAIAAGGLVLCAASARIDAALAARLTRVGRRALGLCALLFGGAHFAYVSMTASLVPKWLPPSQETWVYVTGVGFLAAGVALLTGLKARLAAILLTAMLASFTLLVHLPAVLAGPTSRMNWTEIAVNVAVLGAAWVVADSL